MNSSTVDGAALPLRAASPSYSAGTIGVAHDAAVLQMFCHLKCLVAATAEDLVETGVPLTHHHHHQSEVHPFLQAQRPLLNRTSSRLRPDNDPVEQPTESKLTILQRLVCA